MAVPRVRGACCQQLSAAVSSCQQLSAAVSSCQQLLAAVSSCQQLAVNRLSSEPAFPVRVDKCRQL